MPAPVLLASKNVVIRIPQNILVKCASDCSPDIKKLIDKEIEFAAGKGIMRHDSDGSFLILSERDLVCVVVKN